MKGFTMCSNGCFKTFVSRANQSGCTFRVDCNCWRCFECRQKLEADWNSHAADRFAACPDGIGYLQVPIDAAEPVIQRLHRAGAQYIRVLGHGILHIYTSHKDAGQKALTEQQAVELFAEHLSLAPAGQKHHVISTSRGWRHARRGELPKQHSDAICLQTGLGPEAIRTILERLGQTSSLTAETLSYRFKAPEALESFVSAVEQARRNLPYQHKRVTGNTARSPQVAIGPARFTPNPLFEALRSP